MSGKINSIKKILVATDFSEHSDLAVLRAAEIAASTKARLTILHIAKKGLLEKVVSEVVPIVRKVLVTPKELATSLLKKQINRLPQNKIKINYDTVTSSHPAPAILNYAKKHKIDLLIVGAHGKYSIHDWYVGTTAEYLARKTSVPVLIVKKPPKKTYQKILVPVDFSLASQEALDFAADVFPKADLRLLHVGDHEYEDLLKKEDKLSHQKMRTMREAIQFFLEEKIKSFIKLSRAKAKKPSCDIRLGYPGTVIVDETKKQNRDIVIMGTKGHGKRHYLFIGRVASLVMLEIDRDILLVPPKEKNKKRG